MKIERLDIHPWVLHLLNGLQPANDHKRIYLVGNLAKICRYDAVVVVERILTLPRRCGFGPRMIYIPHGAGDRAKGFSRRTRHYDYVIVSGEKDAQRMIGEGLVDAKACAVSGSIKLGAATRRIGAPAPLFSNGRPTVLYNPHFELSLSSWPRWGREVIARFAAQDEFNLVVAPHVQMFKRADAGERAKIEALAVPGRIRIDLGSLRCQDMSYTTAADVYLGDVSSQVYEFLSRPRPCVFLNAHQADWDANPNYACWHLGEVTDKIADLLPAIHRARKNQAVRLPLQRAAIERALGEDWSHAPKRAAGLIANFLIGQRGSMRP